MRYFKTILLPILLLCIGVSTAEAVSAINNRTTSSVAANIDIFTKKRNATEGRSQLTFKERFILKILNKRLKKPSKVKPAATQSAKHPMAVTALVLGISAFVLSMISMAIPFAGLLALIAAISAIVIGNKAKKRILESGGYFEGKKMANTGVILGIIYCALLILIALIALIFFALLRDL